MIDVGESPSLLRCHVRRTAEQRAAWCVVTFRGVVLRELGDAEIQELRADVETASAEEDVVRLEIAMHDAVVVRVAERTEDRQHDLHGFCRAQASALAHEVAERHALEPLHDDVRVAELGLTEVKHAHDVGMVQPGLDTRFDQKAVDRVGVLDARMDQLQRDRCVERDVLREPHRAHAAFANPRIEPILVGDQNAWRVALRRMRGKRQREIAIGCQTKHRH